jgi:hypothetical protein
MSLLLGELIAWMLERGACFSELTALFFQHLPEIHSSLVLQFFFGLVDAHKRRLANLLLDSCPRGFC